MSIILGVLIIEYCRISRLVCLISEGSVDWPVRDQHVFRIVVAATAIVVIGTMREGQVYHIAGSVPADFFEQLKPTEKV